MQRAPSGTVALLLLVASCGNGDDPPGGSEDAGEDATGSGDASDAGTDADAVADLDDTPDPDDAGDGASDDDAPPPDLPEDPRAALATVEVTNERTLPCLSGEAWVVRTEGDVPHIYAGSRADLACVEGFVTARDRYFEIQMGRLFGLGELTQVLGDVALSTDISTRGIGTTAVADRLLSSLSDEDAEVLDGFAAGVNAYIDAVAAGELPAPTEIARLGPLLGRPRPSDLMWPMDRRGLMGFAAVVAYNLGFGRDDVLRSAVAAELDGAFDGAPDAALRQAGALADIFFRVNPIEQVASADRFGLETGSGGRGSTLTAPRDRRARTLRLPELGVPAPLIRSLSDRLARHAAFVGGLREDGFGSNAWAVHGDHTPDGGALLSGDGHLPLSIPPLFYQIGMDTAVFAGGDVTQIGLIFPGVPFLAVGTNGAVAWSQTQLYGDVVDWYAEELELDENGAPVASRFDGEWRPLERIEESYEIANVPVLGSTGRSEQWARWRTFDGRLIVAIEGRELVDGEAPEEGETPVRTEDARIVPADTNGDGVVSSISLDFAAFDMNDLLGALDDFGHAHDVGEFRDATRQLVAYSQNLVAADSTGNILYSGYQSVPCRGYLDRDGSGEWVEGADPRLLIDGTRYGGFRIPVGADNRIDEGPGATDPGACVVPFDESPQALSPDRGFVLTANNDPAPIDFDNSLSNDPWYIGGPYVSGFRGDSIRDDLERLVARGEVSSGDMADVQANVRSRFGELLAPLLANAIDEVRGLSQTDGPITETQGRAVAAYNAHAEAFDEVEQRLRDWAAAGFPAASGVETFYETPSDDDLGNAAATMIFNAWYLRLFHAVFDDEPLPDGIWAPQDGSRRGWMLRALLDPGAENPYGLASWTDERHESVFFDDTRTTDATESRIEVVCASLVATLDSLSAPNRAPGIGGFGTEDMSQWLWGLRHQVRFESILSEYLGDNPAIALIADDFAIDTSVLPLAPALPEGDPRRGLRWFPRHGDREAVDAPNPDWSGTDFTYGSGPVFRMVISIGPGGVRGQNVIPGGQSGITSQPTFADQAALWLGNDTIPLAFTPHAVALAAEGREVYLPEGAD